MSALVFEITTSEDVKVFSAHLQDSIICLQDIVFIERQHRFAALANRFCWEVSDKNQRVSCGFHFDGVERVRYRGFQQTDKAQLLDLLTISFEPHPPERSPEGKGKDAEVGGILRLIFSNENEIELQVEAVQAFLKDMGEPWNVKSRPQHN